MRNKQVTIKDLAHKLNISTSTVSRALRGEPEVHPETSKKVKELAKELNYKVNDIALSLISKQTHTIGVVIPGYIIHFYALALSAIQEEARKSGYHIIIMQTNDSLESEIESIEMLIHKRVDGLLVSLSSETGSISHFEEVIKKEIPLVLFNRVNTKINVPKVAVDDFKGGYLATKHLIDQGSKHIVHIKGPDGLKLSDHRFAGYQKALEEANIEFNPNLVRQCDFSIESAYSAMNTILDHHQNTNLPDAVFAVCDTAAYGAIKFLREKKIKIPDEVAVIGFTDEPINMLLEPQLSSVAQPIGNIGQIAARELIARIKNKKLAPKDFILDIKLKIRASSNRFKN